MNSLEEGLLEIKCVWVNDNAFYWKAELFEVKRYNVLFYTVVKKQILGSYEYANISYTFNEAAKLSQKFDVFTVNLDKTAL